MEAKELKEFEDYFRQQEESAGPHNAQLSLLAGIGLILLEILKALGGKEPKK